MWNLSENVSRRQTKRPEKRQRNNYCRLRQKPIDKNKRLSTVPVSEKLCIIWMDGWIFYLKTLNPKRAYRV